MINSLEEKQNLRVELGSATNFGSFKSGKVTLCYSLFQNLVKNACEAALAKSAVTITIRDEDPVQISIENGGVVPVGIRDRFFDKFVTHGKQGGNGLGNVFRSAAYRSSKRHHRDGYFGSGEPNNDNS